MPPSPRPDGERSGSPVPNRKRAAAANVAFYYAGVALVILQGFLLVPVYLARIPTDLYGAWLATGGILAWIELVDPGLGTLLQQRVAHTFGARDFGHLPAVVGTGFVVCAGLALLPLAALPLASYTDRLVNYTGPLALDLRAATGVALVSLSTALVGFAVGAVNSGLQRSAAVGVLTILTSIGGIAVTVAMLLGDGACCRFRRACSPGISCR